MHNSRLEKSDLSLGFIPLNDCAPLVVALEKGYFERYGLNVTLSKETSWANIRDKVAMGILDGAQMLASMPLDMSLGLGPIKKPTLTALALDLNGNAVTVSNALHERMRETGLASLAHALKQVIDERTGGEPPLTFATVFPSSPHNYELRYWLATAGIDPDRDIRLIVVPPSQMVGKLESGEIDGYCVGEPWNSQAEEAGIGRTVISKFAIWNNSPEKVFGVTQEWAEQHPHCHRALVMALLEACHWLDKAENRAEAAALLARPIYVNADEAIIARGLCDEQFNIFHRNAANFPWRSHALWFLTQMLRWGQIDAPLDLHALAEQVYRTDLHREAAYVLGLPTPDRDHKAEGLHEGPWLLRGRSDIPMGADRFIDGEYFDPARPLDYLRGQTIKHPSPAVAEWLTPGVEGDADNIVKLQRN